MDLHIKQVFRSKRHLQSKDKHLNVGSYICKWKECDFFGRPNRINQINL